MRKVNRVYTEETFHGEAPLIDSAEAKKIIETDADAKEFVEKVKANEEVITSKGSLNSKP